MTTIHTPGPWIVADAGLIGQAGEPPVAIACCPWADEGKANAALIAAAPEMLEALKECFEWLEAQPGMEMLLEMGNPEVTTLFNDCQSIIAKAEGR